MIVEDADRDKAVKMAESLKRCLKECADEDAYNWLTSLMWIMHRWSLGENAHMRHILEQAKKGGDR